MRNSIASTFETLETRRLNSVSLSKGVLTCYGSARDDNVSFSVKNGTLTISVSRQTTTAAVKAIKSVVINGMYGVDVIDCRNLPLKATINAGDGNDTIYGSAYDDVIHGDAGNDTVNAGLGKNTVFGDAGNDNLTGGDNNDVLNGGDGDDRLVGGKGDDTLTGGRGADRFNGGVGTDIYTDLKKAESDRDDETSLLGR